MKCSTKRVGGDPAAQASMCVHVRLTSGGRDVNVDADLGDAPASERCHAGVGAKVGELQINDVQICGSWGDVRVSLGNDHALRAAQSSAVLQPAELQLLRGRRLNLARDLHFTTDLNVVVVVVRVRRDPKAAFFQRWKENRK